MERSLELLVGVLGILKAGGAYVPLDPTYPQERLKYMIADSGVAVLLTSQPLKGRFADEISTIICLDAEKEAIAREPEQNPKSGVIGTNLAYIIYTSGSTGAPKGVLIEHLSVVNHSMAMARRFQLQPGDKVLQFASFSFDAAGEELFPTWFSGATVVLGLPGGIPTFAELHRVLEDERLTVLNLPTAYWHAWVKELAETHQALPEALRLVIVGGEKALPHQLAQWQQLASARWMNTYGPTEATITSTLYEHRSPPRAQTLTTVPIGQAIANTSIYILDPKLHPVAPGEPGEIYIGGYGLARGYNQRPDLTAERFLPDPFSPDPGARMYQTGDKGQLLPDGNIQYLGRLDRQVKVRGFRIELEEIETQLLRHPSVSACIVLVPEDTSVQRAIVAYVTPQPGQSLSSAELRGFLSQHLPPYMVPSTFVVLDALPFTAQGKVDRHALPPPGPNVQTAGENTAVLETPTEAQLAQIWTQVLQCPITSRGSHFFEMGGDSLHAIQVISRIRDTFHIDIPVRLLFEAPRLAELARALEHLQASPSTQTFASIQPRPQERTVPLSFSQQRLWFFDRLLPGNPLYNICCAVRLEGAVDRKALEQSLHAVVQRHEALRTTFPEVGGKLTQVIAPALSIPLQEIRLEAECHNREERFQQIVTEEAHTPFHLAQGPLIRAVLISLGELEQALIVTIHHSVSDAWSLNIFFHELTLFYNAALTQQPLALPPLPVQYADFTLWQQEQLQGDFFRVHHDYWLKRLAGAPALLELPTDFSRPAEQSYRGAHFTFTLPPELPEALKQLSREQQVTLFMTLFAAFQVLLLRYTGQTDLVVGTPAAGRNRAETEGVIGFFVNTLALRSDLSGNPSFLELLSRVRKDILEDTPHQEFPFDRLVEALHPERTLSHNPICQVIFAWQNAPNSRIDFNGVSACYLDVETATSRFDLTLSMEENGQGLTGTWEYSRDLFEQATIERMTRHFVTLLEGIAAHPEHHLAALPLLPDAERRQMVQAWNDTQSAYPQEECLHQLFEQQVGRTPHEIAVCYQDQNLTYQALNERVNQLARALQKRGVGPDIRVGLCLERSISVVIGLLAILKAGGVYVPLDPSYPRERLFFMLADAQVAVLLTQQSLLPHFSNVSAPVVCLDDESPEWIRYPVSNPTSTVCADNLAYMIYTSGSTGLPKGVMLSHRGLRNLAHAQSKLFPSAARQRILQFASLSFDASIWEITMALTAGSTLVLAPREALQPGRQFTRLLEEQEITKVTLPPTALAVLPDRSSMPCLHSLITAGEACSLELISRWSKEREFFNAYGPTETTVCATIARCTADQQRVTIGRPIANTEVYILDSFFQPVPIGVPGELYIGGAGLARGYHQRPDLTAERFIPHPFSTTPGARLYKTGDWARYLSNGEIEFLGRIDEQVKIRGFRVELGEIEATLGHHPAVREALVLLRGEPPAEKKLVVYLALQPGQQPTPGELRRFLKERLPDYMLPAAWVLLEAFPLLPSGKVDRRALPAPEQFASDSEHPYQAPRSPIEHVLAGIWAELLGRERVSISDNFFEIGGHSLLAAQVISRLHDTFHIEMPLRLLFEAPTIAGLAEMLSAYESSPGHFESIVRLRQQKRPEALPLSFEQQRLWFLEQLKPNTALYSIPCLLELRGSLNRAALESSFNQLIGRHEVLRTTFPMVSGRPQQVILPELRLSLPVTSLTTLSGERQEEAVQRQAMSEARQPFDLTNGPLIRAKLIQIEEHTHLLMLSLHHIIADAWSLSILFRELSVLYRAALEKREEPLPALPIQFADYALWQRERLEGGRLQADLDYWQQKMQGAPPLLDLPADHPRPAIQGSAGAHHAFDIPLALTESLLALGRQEQSTLFMTLLAAFQVVLYRYTGQQDLVIGIPIAGRNHLELEHLIGLFTNTLPFRTALSGKCSFRELLRQVREGFLEAMTHQEVPLDRLIEAINPERTLRYSPLFQVMFSLQNAPSSQFELPGLEVLWREVETGVSKFDLTLDITETSDGLRGTLEYSTDLFAPDTMARMAGHLRALLEGIAAHPDEPISRLPLLDEAEGQLLLSEWQAVDEVIPEEHFLPARFTAQARQTPQSIAAVAAGQPITYQDLDQRSNQVAWYLQQRGVGPEARVGVCLERSIELLIALLGVLKAGSAYIPLDPSYPKARLGHMLADAQAPVLLTQAHLLEKLPPYDGRRICLDTDWGEIAREPTTALPSRIAGEQLAYIIYTSGSTGRPKGVQVTHAALANVLRALHLQLGLDERAIFLAVTTVSFDIAAVELFLPLIVGARTILLSRAQAQNASELTAEIEHSGVTMMQATPATWQMLVESGWEGKRSLTILCGGEKLSAHLAAALLPRSAALWNLYGPTETTIWSSARRITDPQPVITIGRPFANTQFYLLDAAFQPVPIGIPAELYIGGTGLARGYLHRPELTAERFIPHPFSQIPGARLYRTGDRARYLPNGEIEILGRLDHQVKVRGFRIEPGEIEALLKHFPGIEQAVVVVREDVPGDQRLVAYLRMNPSAAFSPADLRRHLQHHLPEYMLPTAFVPLEAFPLTPNGKLDRSALPPPASQAAQEAEVITPHTPFEEVLARIWSQVLRLEQVNIFDNFFELGGHSLLAVQVMARIRDAFQIEMPLERLFTNSTIASLAQDVEEALMGEITGLTEEEAQGYLTREL
jgi:amino acid adenylation domain-containing protein